LSGRGNIPMSPSIREKPTPNTGSQIYSMSAPDIQPFFLIRPDTGLRKWPDTVSDEFEDIR
jgi:hypothetical protein